jgi:hypothetical protein
LTGTFQTSSPHPLAGRTGAGIYLHLQFRVRHVAPAARVNTYKLTIAYLLIHSSVAFITAIRGLEIPVTLSLRADIAAVTAVYPENEFFT